MKISELKEKRIITKDGHFIPLVFSDIYISAKVIGVGAVFAGKEISKQIKDNKFSLPEMCRESLPYTPICVESIDVRKLALSIDDIKY